MFPVSESIAGIYKSFTDTQNSLILTIINQDTYLFVFLEIAVFHYCTDIFTLHRCGRMLHLVIIARD